MDIKAVLQPGPVVHLAPDLHDGDLGPHHGGLHPHPARAAGHQQDHLHQPPRHHWLRHRGSLLHPALPSPHPLLPQPPAQAHLQLGPLAHR